MRLILSLIAVIAISSPADAQSFPLNLFGKSKDSANAESGPLARQLALARLSERHGQMDQASKIYHKVLTQNPKHLVAHHRLGVVETRQGQLESALQHFTVAAQMQPPSSELLSDMGYAHYLANNLSEAEPLLRRAVQLDAGNKAACNNLGLVLGEQGHLDQSLALFRQAGDEASAYANLGYLQSQMGMLDEAEASFHKALDRDPDLKAAAEALLQVAAHRKAIQAHVARSNANSQAAPAGQVQTAAAPAPVQQQQPQQPQMEVRRVVHSSPQSTIAAPRRFSSPPSPSGPVSAATSASVRQVSGTTGTAAGAHPVISADGFQAPVPSRAPAEVSQQGGQESVGRVRISAGFFE